MRATFFFGNKERGVFQWRGKPDGEDAPHQSIAPVFQWSGKGNDTQHAPACFMWNGDPVDDELVAVVQDLELGDHSASEPRDRASGALLDLVVNMNPPLSALGLCHTIQNSVHCPRMPWSTSRGLGSTTRRMCATCCGESIRSNCSLRHASQPYLCVIRGIRLKLFRILLIVIVGDACQNQQQVFEPFKHRSDQLEMRKS